MDQKGFSNVTQRYTGACILVNHCLYMLDIKMLATLSNPIQAAVLYYWG